LCRPELFSLLIQKLQGADLLLTQRVCHALDEVLKELASKRLAADQKVFAEVITLSYLPRTQHALNVARKMVVILDRGNQVWHYKIWCF
jgi:hypothetical protein